LALIVGGKSNKVGNRAEPAAVARKPADDGISANRAILAYAVEYSSERLLPISLIV